MPIRVIGSVTMTTMQPMTTIQPMTTMPLQPAVAVTMTTTAAAAADRIECEISKGRLDIFGVAFLFW
jgi:hypothetical protein